jgi:hypothetical protein
LHGTNPLRNGAGFFAFNGFRHIRVFADFNLHSRAKFSKYGSKSVDSADFFNLTATFTATVKQPKTAKPDGFSGFNPSDFSLSTVGRLNIGATHFRMFLSSLLHIIATVPKRAIYPCATGTDFAWVDLPAIYVGDIRSGPCQ